MYLSGIISRPSTSKNRSFGLWIVGLAKKYCKYYWYPGLHKLWQPGCKKMERVWWNGEEMKRLRKGRKIHSLHFLIFSLFPPSLSISCIKNCLILSQNVKYGTFVANITKNYALWENWVTFLAQFDPMLDQRALRARCLGGYFVMWVPKLLFTPTKIRIFGLKTG